MQALKAQDFASGRTLAEYEKSLYALAHQAEPAAVEDLSQPLRLHEGTVPTDWTDYNGHMNESRYLQVFSNACDGLLARIGAGTSYVRDKAMSYYTAENHVTYLKEIGVQQPYYVTTQLLDHDGKRIHAFHRMFHGRTGEELATGEQMLLHVDMTAGKSCRGAGGDYRCDRDDRTRPTPGCRGPSRPVRRSASAASRTGAEAEAASSGALEHVDRVTTPRHSWPSSNKPLAVGDRRLQH